MATSRASGTVAEESGARRQGPLLDPVLPGHPRRRHRRSARVPQKESLPLRSRALRLRHSQGSAAPLHVSSASPKFYFEDPVKQGLDPCLAAFPQASVFSPQNFPQRVGKFGGKFRKFRGTIEEDRPARTGSYRGWGPGDGGRGPRRASGRNRSAGYRRWPLGRAGQMLGARGQKSGQFAGGRIRKTASIASSASTWISSASASNRIAACPLRCGGGRGSRGAGGGSGSSRRARGRPSRSRGSRESRPPLVLRHRKIR